MTPEKRQILAEMSRSAQGIALKSHLEECLAELGDVSKCTSWEDTLGRKHAKEFIAKSFSFLEKPESKQNNKTSYL